MADQVGAATTQQSPTIVQTKLHAPRRRRGAIARPRLTAAMSGAERPRVVLVSAPAGFGKSTLVATWTAADDPDRGVAWLSLDARDNDPVTFWTYVVAALRTVDATIGETALEILRTAPSDPQAAVAALLGDLVTTGRDLTLVLDDYHVVEVGEIHESVGFLVEHLPPHVTLVIATRVDPPLPLGRLRASGELVERRAADLRFTDAEAAEYLNETMGLALTAADVGALEARTEGWIAALQLAALSLQGRDDVAGFIEGFTGDDRFVVDYLVEEVLDRQPEELRRFLLETSVLSRLTGGLCDAVVGGSTGRSVLDRLDRSNLFVIPLDDRRTWYRYHHLFADVLHARLLDERPDTVADLHRRAARWLAEHDDEVEAIGHALTGGDVELAAELIERTAPALHRVRREALVRGWLEALPAELYPSRPVLSITLVASRMSTGDPTGVDELLRDVESWLEPTAAHGGATPIVVDHEMFDRLPAQAAVYRAALALLGGRLDDTVAHAERALALADRDDHLRRGSATALIGLARWASGDLVAARARYRSAIDLLVRAEHFADALGCLLALADMCRAQGRLDDAFGAFAEGLDLLARHPGLRGAADMHAGLCELHLERNELDRAREHLATSDSLGERAGLPQHPYRSRVAAARLAGAEGDPATALALLDEAEDRYDTELSPSVRPIPALAARVALRAGDLDRAMRWVGRRGLTVDDDLSYVSEFEHLTLARVLVAAQVRERSDNGVLGLLDRLSVAADAGGRAGAVVECRVLEAVAQHALGDREAALAAARAALELAEPERQLRVFLDQGSVLTALLRSCSFDGPAEVHRKRVVGATSAEEPVPSRTGLVDELSSRELDVLRLLRSELSGPDIARELIVSLNTMRTHTKNIYAKLGVTNRREAVRRADELGL